MIVRRWGRMGALCGVIFLVTGICWGASWWQQRYFAATEMDVPLAEFSAAEYPEDPGSRSVHLCQYANRTLRLVKKDERHFDFILEPTNKHTARIVFRDIDVSLMTPSVPEWTKADPNLVRIALTDREWNRQQVQFPADSPHIEITGGNGFEREHLVAASLAKNCLNGGLWEVILSVEENGSKGAYYQGWFTFPLGHYKELVELNTGFDYWDHWYKLEHWDDPEGTPMDLTKLRTIVSEQRVESKLPLDEPVMAAGEQIRKRRTTNAKNVVTWGDFYQQQEIEFATFIPPGRYSLQHPWKHEYWRISQYDGAVLRTVKTPANDREYAELELQFQNRETGEPCRFLVSGIDMDAIPTLPVEKYNKGLYMPMGIGVPPFYQTYEKLEAAPPEKTPYFCLLLDKQDRWINHHDVAIDGPVIHRDAENENRLHVYLLSYERHSLVAHVVIDLPPQPESQTDGEVNAGL